MKLRYSIPTPCADCFASGNRLTACIRHIMGVQQQVQAVVERLVSNH